MGEIIKDQQLCDCTVDCSGRQSCELGTWVRPDDEKAQLEAREALINLGIWLYDEPRTTREIVVALFESISFADDPNELDLFVGFSQSIEGLGYRSTDGIALYGIWYRDNIALANKKLSLASLKEHPSGKPIKLKNVVCPCMPSNFSRVIEFMAVLNSEWLASGCFHTSQIAEMFFPGASQEAIDSWLTEALDNSLFRIGYSPVSPEGDDAGVFDDPIWFCDGDSRTSLKHNLWRGEVVHPGILAGRDSRT